MTADHILTHEFNKMSKDEKKAYISVFGELKVLSTYCRGGFDDALFLARELNCTVTREFSETLRKQYKFCEYYSFRYKQ